jgi:hypothetical protein
MAADADEMLWLSFDEVHCAEGDDDEPDFPDDDDFDKQYTPLNEGFTNEDDPEDDVFIDEDEDDEAGAAQTWLSSSPPWVGSAAEAACPLKRAPHCSGS